MRFTIRLWELNPPKTLSLYAPFGANICNTLCTANACLHYCWYYHIIICITSGITFLSFVIPSVLTSPDLSYYKSAKKAITSSDTSSQELYCIDTPVCFTSYCFLHYSSLGIHFTNKPVIIFISFYILNRPYQRTFYKLALIAVADFHSLTGKEP